MINKAVIRELRLMRFVILYVFIIDVSKSNLRLPIKYTHSQYKVVNVLAICLKLSIVWHFEIVLESVEKF